MRSFPVAALVLAVLMAGCASPPGSASSASAPASARASADAAPPSVAPASAAPASEAAASAAASATALADPLLAMELVDVRNAETFTLAELAAEGPVIVETMAIWCTNCRQQMREVTAAHELAEFHSVSIDVEPTELPEDLAAYAEREGFDWPFVLADSELATELRDRFGTEVLFPPGMPKLLVRPDGTVELLPLGELLDAAEIAALVEG